MYKNLIQGFLLLLCLQVNAQNTKNKNTQPAASHGEIVPNTVVFKLRQEASRYIAGSRVEIPVFETILQGIKINSIRKLVPHSTNPGSRKSASGKKMIDLSTICILEYEGERPVEEVINKFKKSGLVEYAEPQYVERPFYVPNDPEAKPGTGREWALGDIHAYEAWDIEKGDTNIVIGIVDTDINIQHPELQNKIKYNYKDPINGKDDDGDKYTDNFNGWDVGDNDFDPNAKTAAVSKTIKSSTGADSTVTDSVRGNGHGTMVSGCAAAQADNGIGIAGTGFNTKFLPIKAMPDANAQAGGIVRGYEGIVYAAEHGCKVVNISWGSGGSYSALNQDIINFAAINYDVVIVAAAGNDSTEESFYPASYDNVLSVGASVQKLSNNGNRNVDVKANFSNYGYHIDLCAPGKPVYTTWKDSYNTNGGTSFSSPYTAGAAALVRSKFPKWNFVQVQEQLRMTADLMDTLPENALFKEKIGRGRLNMFKALTDTTFPAIRMVTNNFPDNIFSQVFPGDTVRLECSLTNYLHEVQNLSVRISAPSSYVKFIDSTANFSLIKSSDTVINASQPFVFVLKDSIPKDFQLVFRLGFSGPGYEDYQYFEENVNPSYLNIDTNLVALTVTSKGRLGFNDQDNQQGLGFVYKNNNLLFEGGIMVSSGIEHVSDCIRGNKPGVLDEDFRWLTPAKYIPSDIAKEETISEFVDSSSDKVGTSLIQYTYAWSAAPADKFIILQYFLTNTSGNKIDTLHIGIFADFDVTMTIPNRNKSDWDSTETMAYTYSTENNSLFAGVSLLSGQDPVCFLLDHSTTASGNNINPNDGFSTAEKYTALSKGIFRTHAGGNGPGGDVSQIVGASLYGLKNNETRSIAFAILAGDDRNDLLQSAAAAKQMYATLPLLTAVQEMEEENIGITIYPNPAADEVSLIFSEQQEEASLVLTSLIGEQIFALQDFKERSCTLHLSGQPAGMYFLKISTQGKTIIRKIIKL